jgi:hypothetical protein
VCLPYHGPALVIENSRIVHNTMGMNPGGAAGIRSHGAPLTLINSVVADNRGEMAVHTNAPATLLHSTIADADGGVLVNPPETAQLQILNSIIHGTGWAIGLGELGVADVRYTLAAGGYDGDGNIDADPLFANPANGDYKLQAGSPAVNAGTANYPDPLIADLEGRTRDWQPDMGAYELPLLDRDAAARGGDPARHRRSGTAAAAGGGGAQRGGRGAGPTRRPCTARLPSTPRCSIRRPRPRQRPGRRWSGRAWNFRPSRRLRLASTQ